MVEHPTQYPWSSYMANARGDENELIVPHEIYMRLGKTNKERQLSYRQLFKTHISEPALQEIREATNKAWVLGNDRFKQQVEVMTARQTAPKGRGGDRRSDEFRNDKQINRV